MVVHISDAMWCWTFVRKRRWGDRMRYAGHSFASSRINAKCEDGDERGSRPLHLLLAPKIGNPDDVHPWRREQGSALYIEGGVKYSVIEGGWKYKEYNLSVEANASCQGVNIFIHTYIFFTSNREHVPWISRYTLIQYKDTDFHVSALAAWHPSILETK
jgi:hypothetical protein